MAALLVLVSLYDLFSPPVNAMIFRQTQTAMLTENFVNSGFRFSGLTLNVVGPVPALLVLEFPLYNAIVGGLFTLFGSLMVVGKLVSLVCAVISLLLLWHIVEERWDRRTARLASVFFVFTPVGMLMRTAFTPDAITLMFALMGVFFLLRWQKSHDWLNLFAWALAFMVAGVIKFPTLVPFMPLCFVVALSESGSEAGSIRWRMPRLAEVGLFAALFLVPFIWWQVFRSDLIYEQWRGFNSWRNFLIGDLKRFFSLSYYPQPLYGFIVYALCGSGLVLLVTALRKRSRAELLLFAGIPLLYIFVPTVRHQHHYLYSITPILAVLLALGWTRLSAQHGHLVRGALATTYAAVFIVGSAYALRHDNVVTRSAAALAANSEADDLTVGLFLHDRNYVGSEMHPELFYLSGRRGWNVAYAINIPPEKMDSVVAVYRDAGASRLVLTTYDPSLEPWFARWIPGALRRNPNYDAGTVQKGLEKRYRVIASGRNFLVFQL